jgi:hypothetical protein
MMSCATVAAAFSEKTPALRGADAKDASLATNNHAPRLFAQREGAAMLTDEELREIQESIRRITEELANIRAVISKGEDREGHDQARLRARTVDAGV